MRVYLTVIMYAHSDVPLIVLILDMQMCDVELEIDDDHPLALELSSLRTAVARFQVSIQILYVVHTTHHFPSMRHILPHSNYNGIPWKPPWPSSALKPSNMRTR